VGFEKRHRCGTWLIGIFMSMTTLATTYSHSKPEGLKYIESAAKCKACRKITDWWKYQRGELRPDVGLIKCPKMAMR
jgi:hypothetical protein